MKGKRPTAQRTSSNPPKLRQDLERFEQGWKGARVGGREVGQGSLRTWGVLGGAFLGFLSSLMFLHKLMILLFGRGKDAAENMHVGTLDKEAGNTKLARF